MIDGRPLAELPAAACVLLEATPDAMLIVDRVGRIVIANSQAEQLFGCERRVEKVAPALGSWERARVEPIVGNLLSNALKYGAGRPVRGALEADGDSARVTVGDEGPGAAPGDGERLFGRFERAVSAQHYGGLGLSLYLARDLARAHGGEVELVPAPGPGATFRLTLPLRPPSPPPPHAPRPTAAEGAAGPSGPAGAARGAYCDRMTTL